MTVDPLPDVAPAPAVDLEVLEEPAGLFGAAQATPDAGRFRPGPVVTIGGVVIASGPGQTQTRPGDGTVSPVGPTSGPLSRDLIVVDGLTVTWGREDVLEQPEPATGRLTLFDGSGSWATSLDLRGQGVTLAWAGLDSVAGKVSEVFFRGRIGSPVKVRRKTVQMPDGTVVAGSLVDLPLVSILVDLANRVQSDAWPAETMGTRLARAAERSVDVLTGGVFMRDYWRAQTCAPVAAADQTNLLDHLVAIFDSSGADRMTYLPQDRAVTFMERRDYPNLRSMARLWWETTGAAHAKAGQGAFIRAESYTGVNGHVDAAALEYDPADGITQPTRLTRVSVTHPDGAAGYADRTTTRLVAGTDEGRDGVRAARLESVLTAAAYADVACSDLEQLARNEGAAWRLEPLRFSSRKVGGFESVAQAQQLLRGAEKTHDLIFVQRSWLPRYGLRPIFGVMGGTIEYLDEGWELELRLGPITTALAQHAITWEEIDDGSPEYEIQWWDEDHPRGMHESVTYEDLGHVGRGIAGGTVGPDTGWDEFRG